MQLEPGLPEHATRSESPFALANDAAYQAWRSCKLANYPVSANHLCVSISNLERPGFDEIARVRAAIQRANMAVYACQDDSFDERCVRPRLRAFGEAFGLRVAEDQRSAESDGIVRIEIVGEGGRFGYIPYTDKPINWHTDGYYNFHGGNRCIKAMLLHCQRDAVVGGDNGLLDPEVAYIRLRDENPGWIAALMRPDAMTIPESIEAGGRVRPSNVGPVFLVDDEGALIMRYTARKRNVVWCDDELTRDAARRLERILKEDPLVLRLRLKPGQGLICNNVVHDRTGFPGASEGPGRLLYRIRYHNRIS